MALMKRGLEALYFLFLFFLYILYLFVAWENRGELGVIIYNEVIVSILNMRI